MKKIWIIAALVVMCLIGTVVADVPAATLKVNGVPVDLGNLAISQEGSGDNVQQTYELSQPIITPDYTIQNVIVNTKEDPQVSYGLAIIDSGAPSTFSFTFNTPINPVIAGPNQVHSSMSLSATDGGSNGVTVTSVAPPVGIPVDSDGITEMQVTTVFDGSVRKNIGLDLGGPGITFLPKSQSSTWGPFNEGFVSGPVSATGWNNIQININFQGSGFGDIYTLNGRSDIVKPPTIPEFPTMALPAALVVGLIGSILFVKSTKED